jgi:hypothetical protein
MVHAVEQSQPGGAGTGAVRALSHPNVVSYFRLIHGVVGIGVDPGAFYWAACKEAMSYKTLMYV